MEIGWRKKFDFVVVVCTPSRAKSCVDPLKRELDRVGLDVDLFQWGSPLMWERRWASLHNCKRGLWDSHANSRNSTMNHFAAIYTAHALGMRRVLLIEDDIRFLKDLGLLKDLIESAPEEVDIIQMDAIPAARNRSAPWVDVFKAGISPPETHRWVSDIVGDIHSFGCIALNRNAQRWIIDIERNIFSKGARAVLIDALLAAGWLVGGRISRAMSVPLVARQVDIGGVQFNTHGRFGCPWNGWYDTITAYRCKYGE